MYPNRPRPTVPPAPHERLSVPHPASWKTFGSALDLAAGHAGSLLVELSLERAPALVRIARIVTPTASNENDPASFPLDPVAEDHALER
jgi:hypothetical protein